MVGHNWFHPRNTSGVAALRTVLEGIEAPMAFVDGRASASVLAEPVSARRPSA